MGKPALCIYKTAFIDMFANIKDENARQAIDMLQHHLEASKEYAGDYFTRRQRLSMAKDFLTTTPGATKEFYNKDTYTNEVWLVPTVFGLHHMDMEAHLGDRDDIETAIAHYQIIPYISFTTSVYSEKNYILKYTRGSKGDEDRLKTKHSVGFGGHIEDLPPASGSFHLFNTIYETALKEIEEELGLPMSDLLKTQIKNQLATDSYFVIEDSPVGMVHLGIYTNINLDDILLNDSEDLNDVKDELSMYLDRLPFEDDKDCNADVEVDIVKDIVKCEIRPSLLFDYNWEGWSKEVVFNI